MMIKYFKIALLLLFSIAACIALTSCGSGSSGGSVAVAGQDEASPSVSQGSITGFGSVDVNEIDYKTSKKTNYSFNDGSGSEDDLRKGMRVIVKGQINGDGKTGRADEIEYEDDLEGPVAVIDLDQSFLVLLGRTVIVNMNTVIKDEHSNRFDDADDTITPPLSLSDLNVGDLVEVSGVETADGSILATRIERKNALFQPGVTEVGLKGVISNLDDVQLFFNLETLIVDYALAITQGTLANGTFVEVEGTLNQAQDRIIATKVEVEDDLFDEIEKEKVEIEGLVTEFTSVGNFKVDGHPVNASKATFLGGSPDDLGLNVAVEVEGSVNAGTLQAKKVKFHENRVKIHALVQGDPGTNSMKAMDLSVHFNKLTELKKSPFNDKDAVRVRAFFSEGEIMATKIEKIDKLEPDRHLLQGPALKDSKFPPTTFSILGLTVVTTFGTEFEDAKENKVSQAEFFNLLGLNTLVKVRGTFNGSGSFTAD
ncbi:MAG: DUF5666 domain-containing protein, partial [Planctomycetota bacterium]